MPPNNAQRPFNLKAGNRSLDSWRFLRLKEIADLGKERISPQNIAPGLACIELENISKETGQMIGITDPSKQSSQKNIFYKGNVLFGKLRPYLKKYMYCDFDGVCSSEIWVLSSKNGCQSKYLFYLIQTSQFIRVADQSSGTKMPRADWTNVSKLVVPIPPIQEQEKITQILSTWDHAIERVQRLIEAKQRQKKGLMQGLLTGKLRFPEFGEPVDTEGDLPSGWNKTKLKNVADIIVSNVDKLTNENESDVLLCNYMDVYSNEYITSKIEFMRATASQPEISKYRLVRGDVLLTKDSETSEDIASTAVLMEDIDDLICGYHLAILRPKKDLVNPVFLSKHLSFGNAHKHFVTHANGVTRYGLSLSSVINTPIFLPCLDEQTKIADLIMEIDREITIYSQILEMYTHHKKGLMQKLLTGEIRVKLE